LVKWGCHANKKLIMKKLFKRSELQITLLSFIYTATMGVGWVLNPHTYGKLENVLHMIPVLMLLCAYSIFLIKRYKIKLAEEKTKYTPIFWLFSIIIGYLFLINILIYTDGKDLGLLSNLSKLLLATALVGVAEELFYRGYALNRLQSITGPRKALFYSSILFGLMHSVNFLAGPSIAQTTLQVIITAMAGYVFGSIYLSSGRNLILVIILHAIYDFLIFSSTYLSEINNSVRKTVLVVPLLIIVWAYTLRRAKNIK